MKDIFVISVEDIQCLAEYEIGRRLRTEELKYFNTHDQICHDLDNMP